MNTVFETCTWSLVLKCFSFAKIFVACVCVEVNLAYNHQVSQLIFLTVYALYEVESSSTLRNDYVDAAAGFWSVVASCNLLLATIYVIIQ